MKHQVALTFHSVLAFEVFKIDRKESHSDDVSGKTVKIRGQLAIYLNQDVSNN